MVKKLVIFVLLALPAGLLYAYRAPLTGWVDSYLRGPQEDPIPTRLLEPVDYMVRVRARGELTGLQTTPLRPPQVQGGLTIAWLAEEGRLVRAGEVLVRFDNTDALLTLRENQNTVRSYDSQIRKNELDQDTELQALLRDGEAADLELYFAQNQVRKDEQIFTQWEIQESIMSAALAEYKKLSINEKSELRKDLSDADRRILVIEQDKAQLEVTQAQRKLSALEIAAPTSGVLIYRRYGFQTLDVGAEVWSGQEILEIADLDSFRAELWVVEADVAGIEAGKRVALTLDAFPNKVFEARVESISKIAEQRSRKDPRRYFTCVVSLETTPNILAELKPGMRLSGDIEIERREAAFVLPKSAVFKDESRFMVFYQEGAGFREQEVKIVDSDHGFYVVEGVEEGRRVSLRHPFRTQALHLPDFSGPATANQNRRFIMVF